MFPWTNIGILHFHWLQHIITFLRPTDSVGARAQVVDTSAKYELFLQLKNVNIFYVAPSSYVYSDDVACSFLEPRIFFFSWNHTCLMSTKKNHYDTIVLALKRCLPATNEMIYRIGILVSQHL